MKIFVTYQDDPDAKMVEVDLPAVPRVGEKVGAIEQQLAIETVCCGRAGRFTKTPDAGMLARHRSSHRQSITDVLKFSRE